MSSLFQFELPHASSKVFDEGDMPIPAKFKRALPQQSTFKDKVLSKPKNKMKKVDEITTISEDGISLEDYKRSRVKDHVQRFIRQSQDLGTSLGLIKE